MGIKTTIAKIITLIGIITLALRGITAPIGSTRQWMMICALIISLGTLGAIRFQVVSTGIHLRFGARLQNQTVQVKWILLGMWAITMLATLTCLIMPSRWNNREYAALLALLTILILIGGSHGSLDLNDNGLDARINSDSSAFRSNMFLVLQH